MIYKLSFGYDKTWVTAREAAQIMDQISKGMQSIFIRGIYIADARKITLAPDPEARRHELEDIEPELFKELQSMKSPLVQGLSLPEPTKKILEIEEPRVPIDISKYRPDFLGGFKENE